MLALHMQVPLARAGECDNGIPADQFEQKPKPHRLIKPKCVGCTPAWTELQNALDACNAKRLKDAKAAEEKAKADEKKANADKDKAKTDKDKKTAAGKAKEAGTAATKAGDTAKEAMDALGNPKDIPEPPTDEKGNDKSLKDLKADVEKKWKEYDKQRKQCPAGHEENAQAKRAGEGRKPNITIDPIPECFESCDLKKAFVEKLKKQRANVFDQWSVARKKANESGATQADKDEFAQQDANLVALDAAIEAAEGKDCPCPPKGEGKVPVPPGGGGKEQKSMPPPGPGQEQKSMAPGQPPPTDETSGGCKVATATSTGVVTKTITVVDNGELVGEVSANLPDDCTGTFTGTVEAKPAGKTDEQRTRNQAKLNDVVITVDDQPVTPASNPTFTCTMPSGTTNQALPVIVTYKKKQVVKTFFPPPAAPQTPTTQMPWFCQTGRNVVIPSTFNGKADSTDSTKIGGQTVPMVVETQQQRVVRDTSNALGQTELEVTEQGQTTRTPIQNMSVQLSANKSRLKQGEQTTVKATISGMQGVTRPVGVKIVNKSTAIVTLSGGNEQDRVANGSGPDGTHTETLTVTGKTPGVWNLQATLEQPKSEGISR